MNLNMKSGCYLSKFSEKKKTASLMKDMSAVVISESGNLYVADKTILVFNGKTGELCQEFGRVKESGGAGGNKGRYSGLALTEDGALIAARTEKAGCILKVGGVLK